MFNTANLNPLQLGRLNKTLDTLYRINGEVKTLRQHLLSFFPVIEKTKSDGMIDYNRSHFNSLDYKGQAAYTARLKAKRYYWLNDTKVPKVVYDAVQ